MFDGFTPETIDFMWNLSLNNNKMWFEENKLKFIQYFQNPMKELAKEVHERLAADAGKNGFALICKVSRIYKDARRVRGGEPYRCNMWFTVEAPAEHWQSEPVFWFELAPKAWSYGLGFYQAKAETMAKLRARIDSNPKEFEKFTAPLKDQTEFVLDGEEYSRKKIQQSQNAPGCANADGSSSAWYNKKSVSLAHNQQNGDELYSRGLADRLVSGCLFLMPFYKFFVSLDAEAK
ncbi:MAG: DUF2461 domain-containing protein [Defluviitaleaceae bacterium]|nr:DUF2461 domain-containing protein [Defluviitaleaceae bacterium]